MFLRTCFARFSVILQFSVLYHLFLCKKSFSKFQSFSHCVCVHVCTCTRELKLYTKMSRLGGLQDEKNKFKEELEESSCGPGREGSLVSFPS